ncbi:hypothetical protein UPYG_G00001660 [Umbra pygmaea]|uniref:Uncharacterized protein n=1 Tax=Umbra pygmaea TaxID=75934 RepID=A0ABD0XGH8_UMBPY
MSSAEQRTHDHDPRTASLAPVESSVAALENTPSLQTKNRKGERGRGGGRREMGDGRRNWGDLEEGRSRGRGQSPGRQREGGGLGGVRSSGGGGNPDTDLDWPDEEERQPGSHIGQSSLDVADRPKMGHGRVVQRSKQSRRRDRREHLSGVQVMEEMEVQASLLSVRGKRRGGVREPEAAGPAVEDSGPSERDSEVPSFSFLKPLPDGEAGLSDAESSEASRSSWACLSASSVCASTAGAPPPWRGQREETWCPPVCHQADHASYTAGSSTQARRTANAPGAPGPWIKPSQQKLSQVLRAPRIRAGLDL